MTEKMNPPVLGLKLIELLESQKQNLSIRLKNKTEDSPIWNEYAFSYAIEFYKLFYGHYAKFPDFVDHAVEAARHNAVISTLEVLRRQLYNFKSLQTSYERKIFDAISDHIKREAEPQKLIPLRSDIAVPTLGKPTKALAIKNLINFNDPASKRKAFVQPLLDERGWDVTEWARKAKVSRHTAADYLNGTRKTYHSNLKALAEALDVSFQKLPR